MKRCPACHSTYPDDYQTCPRDQSALTELSPEIVPGTVLRGKYEVLCELGTGGMAVVYKVRHKAFQEVAAVKVVHAQFMHDPDFVKRFRNEAIVARQLKHPNAVRIDDFDYADDGRPFIVMEFVEGRSLYEVRKEHSGPWPVERCFNIVSQAAEALGAAHALGIVHRDIKPSNILLLLGTRGEGQVKVLDFGIAKVGDRSFAGMTSVLTQQSLIIGTPEYMSPEQASGGLESGVDSRADLYSLGLVLYEMLTGMHPFKADTPMGMLIQQLHTPPPPLDSFGTPIPPAVSALVLKALHKDPKARFQTAAEMLAAMRDPDRWYTTQMLSQTPVTLPFTPVLPPAIPPAASTPPAAATPPAAPLPAPPSTPPPFTPVQQAAPPPPPIPSASIVPSSLPINTPVPPLPRPAPSSAGKFIVIAVVLLVVLAAAAAAVFRFRSTSAKLPAPAAETPTHVDTPVASMPAPAPEAPAIDPATQQRIDKLLASGNRALATKDYDIAAQFFEQVLTLDKTNIQAQAGLRTAQGASSTAQ